LFKDSGRLKSAKRAKICEVAVMQANSSPSCDNQAPGFTGNGSAGTSGTVERRCCFASCRAFLAASFCFFA
jgi:hypothetical protein